MKYYPRIQYSCLGVVENTDLIKVDLLLLRMHIHRKKASPLLQAFEILSLKEIYLNIKALWSTSEVLQLYCNVVVSNQAGTTRDDWKDRKQIFHISTKLHTSWTKQAGVECCCRGCSDPNADTNVQMYRPTDWHIDKQIDTK